MRKSPCTSVRASRGGPLGRERRGRRARTRDGARRGARATRAAARADRRSRAAGDRGRRGRCGGSPRAQPRARRSARPPPGTPSPARIALRVGRAGERLDDGPARARARRRRRRRRSPPAPARPPSAAARSSGACGGAVASLLRRPGDLHHELAVGVVANANVSREAPLLSRLRAPVSGACSTSARRAPISRARCEDPPPAPPRRRDARRRERRGCSRRSVEALASAEVGGRVLVRERLLRHGHAERRADRLPAVARAPLEQPLGAARRGAPPRCGARRRPSPRRAPASRP